MRIVGLESTAADKAQVDIGEGENRDILRRRILSVRRSDVPRKREHERERRMAVVDGIETDV